MDSPHYEGATMAHVRETTYKLTDHMCRDCGGRILTQATPDTITGGGNPIWRCSNCGAKTASMNAYPLCWCGAHWRGGESMNFSCIVIADAQDNPALREALAQCGCGGESYTHEIGIINVVAYNKLSSELKASKRE